MIKKRHCRELYQNDAMQISAIFVRFSKPNNPRGLLRNGAPLATPLQGHHSTELARLAHLQEEYNYIKKSSNCLFNKTKISFLVTSFADPGWNWTKTIF